MSAQAVIAVNRFGMGARPNELAQATHSPQDFLIEQLQPITFNESLPNSRSLLLHMADFRQRKRMLKNNPQCVLESNQVNNKQFKGKAKKTRRFFRTSYNQLCADSLVRSIESDASMAWRLLDFFSNHFSVTAQGPMMTALAPTLEREALAPNLYGKFSDMVLAVMHHPAMLIYLNNERSFGPNSKIGKRGKGLNENLARELMELHTLGVNGGYTQADVIELAKGISGWGVANPLTDYKTGFLFRSSGHEPGARVLLGKTYQQQGEAQGITMITDLANHPATAKHLCFQLAKHFINDKPDQSLLDKLTKRWLETQGNIKEVIIALIKAEESWRPIRQKFKTPREFVVSAYRALNLKPDLKQQTALIWTLNTLGQRPFNAKSPEGYGDVEADWNGPSALMTRVNWASQLANKKRRINAASHSKQLFADQISQTSFQAISRAESKQSALTLLLMSPEFLRR
ncbi:MAG: DUF1800 domain-containing protein [Parashewanella sp.]